MKTSLNCIPCFAKQALNAVRFATDNVEMQEEVVRATLRLVSDMDMNNSPPVVAQHIHRQLRELTGVNDPYKEIKDNFNKMAMNMLPEFKKKLAQSDNKLDLALRLSIAGNVIDFGINGGLTQTQARDSISDALNVPVCGSVKDFSNAIESAENIYFLQTMQGKLYSINY